MPQSRNRRIEPCRVGVIREGYRSSRQVQCVNRTSSTESTYYVLRNIWISTPPHGPSALAHHSGHVEMFTPA